jgi:hypothetical protein
LRAFLDGILGNNLGNDSFKKRQKLPKSPTNGLSASRSFSFAESSDCEEFRRGQKLQNSHFESAAYANFATPANSVINSLPKAFPKPISLSRYSWGSGRLPRGRSRAAAASMRYRADRDEDNGIETERRPVDLAQARLVDESGHQQAGRHNDKSGPDALQRASPPSRLSHEIRADYQIEQARHEDINVPGPEEEARHRGHALEMTLVDGHVLSGQKKGDEDGNTKRKMKFLQNGLL